MFDGTTVALATFVAPSRLPLLAALLASLLGVRVSLASNLLIKADGDVRVSEVRVAYSVSSLRTVAWEQLTIDEARGELAWLIAVPSSAKGGWIEPADEHFFESLDEATAPVIAPAKALECGAASETTAAPRGVPARPVGTAYAPLAPTAAVDKLIALGFIVDASTRASILALDALGEEVAILILPAGTRGVTRIARVLGPSTRAFPLTLVPTTGARLQGYVLSAARARFSGLPSGEIDPAALSWSGGTSNYGALLDATIEKVAPGAATTFAGSDGIFSDQPGGTTGSTIPSWARRYFTSPGCVSRVAGLAYSPRVVAPTCAKPSAWTPGLTPPGCTVTTSEQIPAADLFCGSLEDVAVAASGHAPGRLVLTRLEGLANSAPRGRAVELLALGSIPSFREAKAGPLCTATTGDAGGSTPTGQPTPLEPAPPSEDPPPSSSAYSNASACSSTADACSRSSSSSDSCSGDSSSGDSCGGDSSSGDGCDGDSSSDSCSSDSGGSSSCKGASDAADDGCRSARARPRIRVSAAMYLLIALAAIARRYGRRSGYSSGDGPSEPCPTTTSSNEPSRE